jgi:hypothetical protein
MITSRPFEGHLKSRRFVHYDFRNGIIFDQVYQLAFRSISASSRKQRISSASHAQVSSVFELGLIADTNTRALKRNRSIALKFLYRALHDLTHRAHHGGNLLVRDVRAGIRRCLNDMRMLSHAAEKQPRHPGSHVSQG